jgi:hypothetical protein
VNDRNIKLTATVKCQDCQHSAIEEGLFRAWVTKATRAREALLAEQKRVKELEEALRPFADVAIDGELGDALIGAGLDTAVMAARAVLEEP